MKVAGTMSTTRRYSANYDGDSARCCYCHHLPLDVIHHVLIDFTDVGDSQL